MTQTLEPRAMGQDLARRDGMAKVHGTAVYADETPVENPLYGQIVQSTIARGVVLSVDTTAAETLDGVVTVLTTQNAEHLASTDDLELAVLQHAEVGFRGQIVAVVVATPSRSRARPQAWCASPTTSTSTTPASPPTATTSTPRRRSTRPTRATPPSATWTPRWRRRR